MNEFNLQSVRPLIRRYPFKSFYFYQERLGEEKLNDWFARVLLKVPNPQLLFSEAGTGPLAGLASMSESPWDNRNIGYKTARIHCLVSDGDSFDDRKRNNETLLQNLRNIWERELFEYVFCRVNASDLPALAVLQEAGFQVVDGLLTLSWKAAGSSLPPGNGRVNVREARGEDMEAVRQIAAEAFIFDRFHSDPAIPDPVADRLHANWIEDSFAKNPDDRVLVAEKDGTLAGFLSYSNNPKVREELGLNILTIILLATGKRFRGEGAAGDLIMHALNIALENDFDFVHTGTQLRNIRANRLYLKMNFQLVDSSYTLRKLMR